MSVANRVRAAVVALADAAGGELTPNQVIAAARPWDSPLHGCFTWDNRRAGDLRRIDEARALIRSVRLEITTHRYVLQVPAYVRNPAVESKLQGYISVGRLQTADEMARDAVVAEFQRAAAALRRARNLCVALGLERDVDRLLSGVLGLSRRLDRGGDAAAA